MSRPDSQRRDDILRALDTISIYRPFLDNQDSVIEEMAMDAVLRQFAVIGEAVRALSEETRASHPEVPWKSIIGLRNIVIHEYFAIRPVLIQDIVDHELPALRVALGGPKRTG